jgi:hypothetical protein
MRTCLVSAAFFFAAVSIQFCLYPNESFSEFKILSLRPGEAFLYLLALFILNFVVDYFSNITTISLLRMAARSGSLFDTLLVFLADVTLTVTVFTLIYPVGILFDLVINQTFNRSFVATAREANQITKLTSEDQLKTKMGALERYSNIMEIRVFYFRDNSESETDFAYGGPTIVVLYPKNGKFADLLEDYADFMQANNSLEKYEIKEGTNGKFTLHATLAKRTIDADLIVKMYYAAYRNSNIMRDNLINLVRLEPQSVSFSGMYSDYEYNINVVRGESKEFAALKCSEVLVRDQTKVEQIDYFVMPWVDIVPQLNKCSPRLIIFNLDYGDFWWDMQGLASMEKAMPITPFFFTSFASSILYYAIILLVALGSISFKIIQRFYKTPYFNTKEMPLTILMLLAMIPIFILETLISTLR